MINRRTWAEFREIGMLWWINMILHTLGWAIVLVYDQGEVVEAYPARVTYRGFSEKANTEGYIKVTNYLADNSQDLLEEAQS